MRYIRRTVWFLATRLLAVTIIVSILVCGFYMAMNTANIYIIVSDGLEERVHVILTAKGAEKLTDYFHADFLNNDVALQSAFDGSSAFGAYSISDYDYVLTINSVWAWPWDANATCTVTERVKNIKGSVLSSRRGAVSDELPKWQGGKYNLTLARSNGKWKITGIKQTGIIIEEDPTPSPAPEETQ